VVQWKNSGTGRCEWMYAIGVLMGPFRILWLTLKRTI